MTRIAVGADHAGFELKEEMISVLEGCGLEVVDVGTRSADESVDYPDFAHAVAGLVAGGEVRLGLLVCGTGIGMSMSANRHPGVRAVVCSDPYSAMMARRHNDANVLCMGARVVGAGLAQSIIDAFLEADFDGGRHQPRVAKIELAPE